MKKLSHKRIAAYRDAAQTYMALKDTGKTVEEIAEHICRKHLGDQDAENAKELVHRALKSTEEFTKNYRDALHDRERFVAQFQDRMDEGRDAGEQCAYWSKFTAAVVASSMENVSQAEREAMYHRLANRPILYPTPELAQKLREQAAQALKQSTVLVGDLDRYAQELENLADGSEAAQMLLEIQEDEHALRAITAVLMYCEIKRGMLKGAAQAMTIEQVAATVCAAQERSKVLAQVDAGEMLMETGIVLLNILGTVLILAAALVLFWMGVNAAFDLFSILLAIPVVLLLFASIYVAMTKGIDAWCKLTNVMVKAAWVLVKSLCRAAVRLARYVRDVVLPRVAQALPEIVRRVYSFVDGKVRGFEPVRVYAMEKA